MTLLDDRKIYAASVFRKEVQEIRDMMESYRGKVDFISTKAHAQQWGNEMVDGLAKRAAQEVKWRVVVEEEIPLDVRPLAEVMPIPQPSASQRGWGESKGE